MQVFHVKDAIIHVKDIDVNGWCPGLEYFEGSWIKGYCDTPTRVGRVEMVSEEGDILHTLTTNSSGEDLFEKPAYIRVDSTTDNPIILVSDWGKKAVYMLDTELQLLQAFKLPLTGEPRGLSAVGGGQVLVVDDATWTLQLLDLTTGQWRAVLGEAELQHLPYSLVYNQATRCVFVAGGGDEVRVYTLSKLLYINC